MQTHHDFFPHVLFPDDLQTMSLAHRGAMAQEGCTELDPDSVALIALRLYRMGVVDKAELGEATVQAARRMSGYIPS